MARKKTGQAPGRKSDFTGEKYEWLDGFRDAVRDATGDPGTVYTDVTRVFLLRYGYDLPFGENVNGNPEDHPPVISADPDPEEKEHRTKVYKQLRTVSFLLLLHNLIVLTYPGHRNCPTTLGISSRGRGFTPLLSRASWAPCRL
jgi:hypothetical protein